MRIHFLKNLDNIARINLVINSVCQSSVLFGSSYPNLHHEILSVNLVNPYLSSIPLGVRSPYFFDQFSDCHTTPDGYSLNRDGHLENLRNSPQKCDRVGIGEVARMGFGVREELAIVKTSKETHPTPTDLQRIKS